MSLKKAVELIKRHKVFLITTHINPEADAIGSELAFLGLLKKLGKEGFIVNESEVPVECRLFPRIGDVLRYPVEVKEFDCAVYLDSGDLGRAGEVNRLIPPDKPSLNIDHHFSNKRFARVNWVSPQASCACEMVYRLYKSFKAEIGPDAALWLYAGIAGDTGSFHYSNTTSLTHRVAADLLKRGVSPQKTYSLLFENNTFGDMKLLGQILFAMECACGGRIVWADIPRGLLSRGPAGADLAEEVLGLMRSIKGVELAIAFREVRDKKGKIRINFRSQSYFDCNHLAAKFGGGGHKNASGATVLGDLAKVKRQVIRTAKGLI